MNSLTEAKYDPSTAEYWSISMTCKQLSLGRNTVLKLVAESNARVKVGRRVLVNRKKLLNHLDSCS